MSRVWKGVCVFALVLAAAALGVGVAVWTGVEYEAPTARSDAPVYIDLTKLMLQYDDPLRGMDGSITYRKVFQDALWWQITDPQVSEATRVDAFFIVGALHEGRGAELTPEQYEILIEAVQRVWGPAVVAVVEAELQ